MAKSKPSTKSSKPSPKAKPSAKAKPQPQPQEDTWDLRLYVAGQTPKSLAAFENLRRICEEHLPGRYTIEVIDLVANPKLARDHQIVAIPTLIRKIPEPLRRIIGDLSDTQRTLVGLQLSLRDEQ